MVVARNDKPQIKIPTKPLPVPPKHCIPPQQESSFDKKDANKDGKLNADEFNEGRGLLEQALDPDKFDRYDANNDGYVSKFENAVGQMNDARRKSKLEFEPKLKLEPKQPQPDQQA